MKVEIPKPCNEKWEGMTPTQRGAFCKTCAIDVIDFSNKNADEVKETLRLNIGKQMCGRFKKSQLSALSLSYQIWENQSVQTFQSKFLWACVIAFGLTLFTGCENSNAQSIFNSNNSELFIGLTGEDSLTTIKDTTINYPNDTTDFIIGDIEYIPEPEPEIDDTVCNTTPIDTIDNDVIKIPVIKDFVMGKIAPPPRFEEYLADSIKVENLTSQLVHEKIEARAYPNPTNEKITLEINANESEYYNVALYDYRGAFIQNIYSGSLNVGMQRFEIDLSLYEDGIYLIKLTSDYVAHALKVNKMN